MGYLRLAVTIAVLVGFGFCCGIAMADGEPGDVCEPGYEPETTGDWALIVPGSDEVVHAGDEVQFRLKIGDMDCHGTPTRADELTIDEWPFQLYQDEYGTYYSPSPTSTPPDNVNIMSEEGGTVKQYHVTFNDTSDWYNDPDPDAIDIKVTWVGVANIVGERNTCKSAGGASWNEQVYSVITNPAGHEDMVTWTVTGAFSASEDQDHQMHVYMPVTAGTVTVTATCGTSSETKTIYVSTLPDPNDTPSAGGGGGCSSGSCGSGGSNGFPSPSPWNPVVEPDPGDWCCDCGDGGGEDCGEAESVGDLECEGAFLGFQYTDSEGRQYNNPNSLGNLTTISRTADQNGHTTGYTITSADGTTTEYGPPIKPSQSSSIGYSRKAAVTDADGRETIYNRDPTTGALLYKRLPNGDTYYFEHPTNEYDEITSTKVTKVTAPDGTYTSIEYVDGGIADGKVESVDTCDATNTPLSHAEYDYDGFGRVTSATVNGHELTYAYSGNTITMTDTSAYPEIVTVYAYGDGVTTVTRKHPTDSNLDQPTTHYFHKLDGQNAYLWKVQDPTGAWTYYGTYVLDTEEGYSGTNGTDYTETSDLDLIGKVFRVEDALNRVTSYSYDSDSGALNSVTYPGSYTEEYRYYQDGSTKTRWLMAVENVRGNHTFYERPTGARHQVVAVKVAAAGAQTPEDWTDADDWQTVPAIKTYDYYTSQESALQVGLLEKETVPDIDGTEDYYKTYTYLNGNRLEPGPTSVAYPWKSSPDAQSYGTQTEHTSYDVMGRMLSTTDANNRMIWNTYDAQGRQLQTIYAKDGSGNPTVYTESVYSCCTLDSTVDEEGRTTSYKYDDAKRVRDVWTNIDGQSEYSPLVHYEYDTFGNVSSVSTHSNDGPARITGYTYDKNNRVIRMDYPYVSQDPLAPELFQYDAVGNLIGKRVGESGPITAYEYDDLNRLARVEYNYENWPVDPVNYPIDEPGVTYTYDGASRLRATMEDASGTSEYQYDERDRLVSYTPPKPANHDPITYEYNNLNQKTAVVNGWNSPVEYEYYANGWLKKVAYGPPIAEYTYDQVGNRTRVDRYNTTYTLYDYGSDPRYFLSSIAHWRGYPTDVELGTITYDTRDDSGNPTIIDDWTGTKSYTYDANNRLITGAGASFGYDWVGNRLNPPANPNPMVYDATDKLVAWPNTHQYTYYPTGSLYQQKDSQGGVQKIFSYTGAELLSSVTHAGINDPSEMVWDGDASRVSFTSSTGGTTEFVYDTTAGIPAVLEEVTSSGSMYYIREPNGALLARAPDGSVSTATKYYHFDELGSTRMLTDYQGTVTDTYTYDAWGKQIASTGSTAQPYRFVGQLGYYSHYQDTNLFSQSGYQFLQLGVRFYDPLTGRFTQRDPVSRDRCSSYPYADDCPTWRVDPSGKVVLLPVLFAMLGIAITVVEVDCINEAWEDANRINDGGEDKVAHCLLPCRIKRCLLKCRAADLPLTIGMWLWEIIGGGVYDTADVDAGKVGLDCASDKGSCSACCRRELNRKGIR